MFFLKNCIIDLHTKHCIAVKIRDPKKWSDDIVPLSNLEWFIPIIPAIIGCEYWKPKPTNSNTSNNDLIKGQFQKCNPVDLQFHDKLTTLIQNTFADENPSSNKYPLVYTSCQYLKNIPYLSDVRCLFPISNPEMTMIIGFVMFSNQKQLYFIQPLCQFVSIHDLTRLAFSNPIEFPTILQSTKQVFLEISKYKKSLDLDGYIEI